MEPTARTASLAAYLRSDFTQEEFHEGALRVLSENYIRYIRLEVQLPWLLSLLANRAKGLVQKQAKLMLEKPSRTK
jgi:hypothetical protein